MMLTKEQSQNFTSRQPHGRVNSDETPDAILPVVADQLLRLAPRKGLSDWVLLESEEDGQLVEVPIHTGTSLIAASFQSANEAVWNLELDQPGTVSRFQAEDGQGENVVHLLLSQYHKKDAQNPSEWLIYRSVTNPDVVWVLAFFKDQKVRAETISGHLSRKLFNVLAKPPVRVNVCVALSGFAMI